MVKKIISLLLAISMSISFISFGTWAEEEGRITVSDDFNNASIVVQNGGFKVGDFNNAYYAGPIMNIERDVAGRQLNGDTVTITEQGYTGKALLLSPVTKEIEYGEFETPKNIIPGHVFSLDDKLNVAEASYRICVRNRGEKDDEALRMDCGFSTIDTYDNYSALKIYKNRIVLGGNEENNIAYDVNTWYTVEFKVTKNEAQIYLKAEQGEILASAALTGEYDNLSIGFINPKSTVQGFSMAIDDAFVSCYRSADLKTRFDDVSVMHWAYDYVEELADKQILNGVSENLFAPGSTITREQFVKMAVATVTSKLVDDTTDFDDVDANAWYAPYISTALQLGLMVGASDTHFGVGTNITREEVMIILDQILSYKHVEIGEIPEITFDDKADITEAAIPMVARVVATGLINGDDKGCVRPKNNLTRAEVCAIISRLDALINPLETSGDRLDQQMPESFEPTALDRTLLATIDFENGRVTSSSNATVSPFDAGKLDQTEAYEGKTSYRFNAAESSKTITLKITGLDLKPGEAVLGIAHAKTKGLTTASGASGLGARYDGVRSTMGYQDSATGAGQEIYQIYETISGDLDWTTTMQYTEIATEADTVTFGVYVTQAMVNGTAWIDNISVYRVAFDPFLEAILETPTFHGLIYGEGGEGDINLSTSVRDYGVYDLTECEVNAKIVDENDKVILNSNLKDIQEEIRICFSSKHLEMNKDYYLQLTLDNVVSGEQISFREWTLRKRPEDYRPNNYFDEFGRYIIDGKPTFLNGIYGMNYLWETIDDLKGTPINALLPYGWTWFSVKNDGKDNITTGADRALLDYANENGIKLIVSMTTWNYDIANSTGASFFTDIFTKPEVQRDIYDALGESFEHPGFLGYYLADEQSAPRFGAILEWQSRIHALNNMNSFTFNTFTRTSNPRTMFRFADTTNCSCYPIDLGDDTDDMSRVTNWMKPTFDCLPEGNRPLYVVLQCTQWSGSAQRGPSQAEIRSMIWQSICMGAQGILWYDYFDMKGEEGRKSAKYPFDETWPAFVEVLEELEEFYPVILSTEDAPAVEVKAADNWFSYIAKRHEGKTYVFTSNRSRSSQTARIKVEGAKTITGLYSGETYSVNSDGWFEVEYPSIGVEIFEIEQEDYLSPKAQLTGMGFFDGATTFVLSNEEDMHSREWQIVVPSELTTLEYAATINEKATLYINGEKVESSGSISISGVDTLSVKVVAEDTRFSTEYTYRILRGGAYE